MLFVLSGRGITTPLHRVNSAGQRDRDVQQSFMAPSQSHDTTCVLRCPIFTRHWRPPTPGAVGPGRSLNRNKLAKWTTCRWHEHGARVALRHLRLSERGDRTRHPAPIPPTMKVPTGAASQHRPRSSWKHAPRKASWRPRWCQWPALRAKGPSAPPSTLQVL